MGLLSAKSVGEKLGLGPLSVIRMHDNGSLSAVEIARHETRRILRWRPEDVERFIAARERKEPERGRDGT